MRRDDFDVWFDKFEPHMTEDGENLRLYDWHDKDLEILNNTDFHYVWTIVDGDNGSMYIIPGFHYVNRMDYLITKNPWKDGQRDYKY